MSSDSEYSDTDTESTSSFSSSVHIEVRTRSTKRLYFIFIAVFSLCCIGTILSIPAMLPKITNEDHMIQLTTEDPPTAFTTNAPSQPVTVVFESTAAGFSSESPINILPVNTTLDTQTTENVETSAYLSTTPSKDNETTQSAEIILTTESITSPPATSELVTEYMTITQLVTQRTFDTSLAPEITTLDSFTTSSEDSSSSFESTQLSLIETTLTADHTDFTSSQAISSTALSLFSPPITTPAIPSSALPITSTPPSVKETSSVSTTTVKQITTANSDNSLQPGHYYIQSENGYILSRSGLCWPPLRDGVPCVGHTKEKKDVFTVEKHEGLYTLYRKEKGRKQIPAEYWVSSELEYSPIYLDSDFELATRWIIEIYDDTTDFYFLKDSNQSEDYFATLTGEESFLTIARELNDRLAPSRKFKFIIE